MITAKIAWQLRYKRGLLLPTYAEYASPRLAEIAVKQAELMKEMDNLDDELLQLANDQISNKDDNYDFTFRDQRYWWDY